VSHRVLIKKHSFLAGRSKEDFLEDLRNVLRGKVIEAYILGSFLSDDFNVDSDLDLIVIANTTVPFIRRRLEYPEIDDLGAPIDLLVYTTDEFAKLKADSQNDKVGFWKTAFSQMKKII
jgi:predicted nucleotidyltransferase